MKEHRLPHCEHSACSKPRVKGLHKIHHFLCAKSSHYHSWHYNKHHRKTHYAVLAIYLIAIIAGTVFTLMPQKSKAATSFEAHFDSGSLDADSSIGSGIASNNGTSATLTTPGYGGSGQAVSNLMNESTNTSQSLKYPLASNLDTAKGEIELKFQAPYSTGVNSTKGIFGQLGGPKGIAYDPASQYIYVADSGLHRIVKTKFDGTDWTWYGYGGSGKGQFNNPQGLAFDASSGYLYIADSSNHRIVKTKFDGTGWTTYGSSGSGVGNFNTPSAIYYDSTSEYLFIADTSNHRIVKTKFDGTGWTTYGTTGSGVGNFSSPSGIYYDSDSQLLFVGDTSNHRVVKTQIDGTGWTTYGSSGSGVGNFNTPRGVYYNNSTEFLYIADYNNHRWVITKIDGTGWTTKAGGSRPYGITFDSGSNTIYSGNDQGGYISKFTVDGSVSSYGSASGTTALTYLGGIKGMRQVYYDPTSKYLFIADFSNHRIIRTKYDGTDWAYVGTSGVAGSGVNYLSSPSSVFYDPLTEFLYIADLGNNRIVKTKIDGTGWTTYGTTGSGVGNFSSPRGVWYDNSSEYIYIADTSNYRIVKTKIDGTGWETFGSQGSGVNQFVAPKTAQYNSADGYLYIGDQYRIIKTQMDGTGWTAYGSNGNGVGNFNVINQMFFDVSTEYYYVVDQLNGRLTKTQIDGTGWSYAQTNLGNPMGVAYDSTNSYLYIANGNNPIIYRRKLDGSLNLSIYGDTTKNLLKTSGTKPMVLQINGASGQLKFFPSQGDNAIELTSPTQTLTVGTWYTIKIVYNNSSGTISMLLNGNQIATTTDIASWDALSNLGGDFYIGSDPSSVTKSFTYPVDDIYLRTTTADTTAPTNPTTLVAKNHSGGNIDLVSGNWYNHSTPYFSWSGALDTGGSGIKDYLVYWGTNASADPRTDPAKTIQTGTTFEPTGLIDGTTYYLKVKARDMEYNVAEDSWSAFVYKYDNSGLAPPAPTNGSHNTCLNSTKDPCTGPATTDVSPSSLNRFSFSWDPPTGKEASAIAEYRYAINTLPLNLSNTSSTTTEELSAGAFATQQDENVLRIVAKDFNGIIDYNNYLEIPFWAVTTAPSQPLNVLATDSSDRSISKYRVTLSWTEPSTTGDNFDGYNVYRADLGGATDCDSKPISEFSKIASNIATTNDGYYDGGLESKYYCYYTTAIDNAGNESAPSTIKNIKPTGAFIEPATLKQNSVSFVSGASSLSVTFSTLESDHPCTPRVRVYSSDSDDILVDANGSSTSVVDHSVKVNGLRSSNDYRFQPVCTDVDGNMMEGAKTTFKTDTVPALYDVIITDKTLTSAVINFKTATDTKSAKVIYGTSDKYLDTTERSLGTAFANSNQTVRIDNLTDETTYYYRIIAIDKSDNELRADNSFTTPAKPVIKSVQLQPVADAAVTTYDVVWSSNVPISSSVVFSASGKSPKSSAKGDLETEHSLRVEGLEDQATYSITVSGRDQFGNMAEYTAPSVTTPIDTRAPKLSNLTIEVRASGVGTSQKAQIIASWETDEPSTSMVEYDQGITGDSYGFRSQQDATYTTSHVVILSELEPSKLYHLRAVSIDKAGNQGNSPDTSAITGKTQKSIIDIILNSLINSFGWMGKIFN